MERNLSLIKLDAKLRRDLDLVLIQGETLWYQKAHVEWLKDGDRNTAFFHLSTIIRKWKTRIVAINNDANEWLSDPMHLKIDLRNGEKTDSFSPSRGIRQGDPLSPYLFVLCMERLNQVIQEGIIRGH